MAMLHCIIIGIDIIINTLQLGDYIATISNQQSCREGQSNLGLAILYSSTLLTRDHSDTLVE